MSTTAATQDQSSNKSPKDTQFKLITGNHRGRLAQIPIYLGKNFRMFIYQTDWKVLPMSALIAALIAFVVGENMFVTMEGQFQCSLALTCVCIWNGFFNSIQSVCRERSIVKREHRSGMHISSYVTAHLIYQMFLCAMQALITVLICQTVGIKLMNRLPQWVEASSSDDDTNVGGAGFSQTTFGLKYLLQGIYDGYRKHSKGEPYYFELKMELNR